VALPGVLDSSGTSHGGHQAALLIHTKTNTAATAAAVKPFR